MNGRVAESKSAFTVDIPVPEVIGISPESGLVNTEVTISGSNFSTNLSDNKVLFKGTEAVLKSATATKITVIVPAGAVTGPVKVTVKGVDAVKQPEFTVATLPSVTTLLASKTSATAAKGGGTVVSDGGSAIISRGVCWSSSNLAPLITDNKTEDGSGTGTFASTLSGLNFGDIVYVRAYATNQFGTSYGEVVSFLAVQVGETWQGGVLCYHFKPGDFGYVAGVPHGIIVAPTDIPADISGLRWQTGVGKVTGAANTEIGKGKSNTELIVASVQSGEFAAKACTDLEVNGFSDWFLPSKDELNLLYINRELLGKYDAVDDFWSSSETSNSTAWMQKLSSGTQFSYDKSADNKVRAIRYF